MSKFVTDDGRVHIAEPAHVNSSPKGMTQVQATEWATASDLISVNPSQFQGFDQLIASLTTTMMYTKACGDTDAHQPESNYSHNHAGERKGNKHYTPVVNIMQPGSGWDAHERDRLLALKMKYPYIESVFNDTARASYDIGGPPVVPGTHTIETRDAWNAKLKAKMDLCNNALGYEYWCLNGLNMADTMRQFTPCIGMIESTFGALDHTLPNLNSWRRDADTIWRSQDLGWTPWVYVKMNALHGSAEWDAFRSLTLASAMLLDKGSLLYCIGGREQTDPAWVTREYTHPWYNPGIGTPAQSPPLSYDSYLQVGGAYVKLYTQGAVVVNPTTTPVVAELPGAVELPLKAQSGAIMAMETVTTTTWSAV